LAEEAWGTYNEVLGSAKAAHRRWPEGRGEQVRARQTSGNPGANLQSLLRGASAALRFGDTPVALVRLSQACEGEKAKVSTNLPRDCAFFPYSKDARFADFFTNRRS
jgi:hypothetical protein